jgi:hypothetical protein
MPAGIVFRRIPGTRKLVLLWLLAAMPRILGAFFLPNAFGDAYVYIQEIGTLSTKISSGSFRLTDLFGFWLPLYQLIAALVNVLVKNGFYSGKIVAAIFGAGGCLFVYLVTHRLTNNETAALWIFLLIAFNPLHIFYSASAMTDVPHACFVLAALYFVLTGNWIVAAIFAALAGGTRVESWMLIALLPFIQFVKERRISVVALLILFAPPLLWFFISWQATGNWLECFVQRQQYHDWLLRMNPAIAQFSIVNVSRDAATLLVSSDVAVLIAAFVAGWLFITRDRNWMINRNLQAWPDSILTPLLFFFAFFALLFVAYLTHQQPIIFPRYGLILFTMGLPILAWTLLKIRAVSPRFGRCALIATIVLCGIDATVQGAGVVGTLNQYRAQRAVADYLRDHFDFKSPGKVFCDDGTVRVLSGVPEDRFVDSTKAPRDRDAFLRFLDETGVDYLIVIETERSTPFELFGAVKDGASIPNYDRIKESRTTFIYTAIHVFRRSRL